MTRPVPDEDGWTETVDLSFDRVDLVKGPANGVPFLLMKAATRGPLALVPQAQEAKMTVAKAANQKSLPVLVYDAQGNPMGVVADPTAITAVQTPGGPAPAVRKPGTPTPPDAAGDSDEEQAAKIVDEVAKALGDLKPRPGTIRKATANDVRSDYATFVKGMDATHRARVDEATSSGALRLIIAGAAYGEAVRIAKAAALRVGRAKGLI